MNEVMRKSHLEASIQLVREWKHSGMTQMEFAKIKGMTERQIEYQVRKVRKQAPEYLDEIVADHIEFAPVPQEHLSCSNQMYDAWENVDQHALMFKSGSGCLQATNQIDPYLLKVAMEVMLSC